MFNRVVRLDRRLAMSLASLLLWQSFMRQLFLAVIERCLEDGAAASNLDGNNSLGEYNQ
jgi:hypothetical protein